MAFFSKGVTIAFLKTTGTTPVGIDLFTIRAIIGDKGLICCFNTSVGIGSKLPTSLLCGGFLHQAFL